MSKPIPFSQAEIDSVVLEAKAEFEADFEAVMKHYGVTNQRAAVGMVWKQATPQMRRALKTQDPAAYRRAVSMFGE